MPLPRPCPFRKDPPISSPHTDRPLPGHGAPTWVRFRVADHLVWAGCTALPVIPLTLIILLLAIYVAVTQGDPSAFAGLVLPGLILATAIAVSPANTCEQGIEVGEQGLRLRKKPKWWYPGRSVDAPWDEVQGLTVVRHHPGRADRQLLAIPVDRIRGLRPKLSWLHYDRPGSDSRLVGDLSPGYRLVAIGRQDEVDAVVAAVVAMRPDLPVEETSTDPRRPLPTTPPQGRDQPGPETRSTSR